MLLRRRSIVSILVLTVVSSTAAIADVTLPAIFSDHAVLQEAPRVPVWGTAAAGEKVLVTLDGATAESTANAEGRWAVELDLKSKGPGPYTLQVKGKNTLTIEDVLVGEVWLCSGQSNMEWVLANTTDGAKDIAASENKMLRQFLVKRAKSTEPLQTLEGTWTIANPKTAGSFTAVGYYFGKRLNAELHAPVGLINSSWGGTPSEAWTSGEAIDTIPDLNASKERQVLSTVQFPEKQRAFVEAMSRWLDETHRADRLTGNLSSYAQPTSKEGWIPITLPGSIAAQGLPKNGAFWLYREMTVPEGWKGKPVNFECEAITGMDALYWNGNKVGETTLQQCAEGLRRRYTIPADQVSPGISTLAFRIYAPAASPKMAGGPASIRLNGSPQKGEWLAKAEFELPPLDPENLAAAPVAPKSPPGLQNVASGLFNAMINPLIPYAIKGVVWYQGESNAGRAFQYRTAFPLLIQDWRRKWNQGEFPFYFCQLANFMDKQASPGESGWAELREAQALTLSLPNTGMATLIDIGETKDIHPRNKKDVGERLAAIALARDYGKQMNYQGPMYESMVKEKDKIVIKFKHIEGGLIAKPLPELEILQSVRAETAPLKIPNPNSELQGFAICGNDRSWKWANAKIQGDSVIVLSDEVSNPIAVRYAWAHNPTCNLYNGAGFPAVPFRTDDFPGTTDKAKY